MDASEKHDNLVSRREFFLTACRFAAIAGLGGTLGTILQSCSQPDNPADAPSIPTINGTVANGTIAISAASGSPVAAVGSAALIQYGGGSILLAHTASDTFAAVSAICTHQGCLINSYSGGTYTCPCHGSQFATNGQVTRGPAGANLRAFPTSASNNQVLISV